MNFNLPAVLTALTLASGAIYLVDKFFFAKARLKAFEAEKKAYGEGAVDTSTMSRKEKQAAKKADRPALPIIADYARELFPVFLVVLLIRSFAFNHYRVPTGSLEPTIMPGDFVLVSQYAYGIRSPLSNKTWIKVGTPKHGQIALTQWPVDMSKSFVKRVVGLPGDSISYINKVLYINGKEQKQKFVKNTTDPYGGQTIKMKKIEEDLMGVRHYIYVCADQNACPTPVQDFYNLKVPKGHYFLMGDNRDNSDDARGWGFVSQENLMARGLMVWMNWDPLKHTVMWHRIGSKMHLK